MWEFKHDKHEIYSIDIASKAINRITHDAAEKTSIVISPDGSKMLYVSDKNGIGNPPHNSRTSNDIRHLRLLCGALLLKTEAQFNFKL